MRSPRASGERYVAETQAFFACRAATWDVKFGDDLPAYRAAVREVGIAPGGVAIDVGCGTGSALLPLREPGPDGSVIAVDLTAEMLAAARPKPARRAPGSSGGRAVAADRRRVGRPALRRRELCDQLPIRRAGLRPLAGCLLGGLRLPPVRAGLLAARHGRVLAADEPLAEGVLHRSRRPPGGG